ncbi:SUMF1/EgtB/PvdO family nonheme iron enzyme [Methanococcoides sp. FTZ1]|uniref:formylglycine-generating enzyme family protein n=1 Tax=Methanococcoides sp. FTZ1 TaxID=3439061 RepID=UPI003F85826D
MKNELGMDVPSYVCEKAKEIGCYQGVKYVYMDGDYGGKFPASSLGGKKGTRFEDIDSANACKIDLGSGWITFTSPFDDGTNASGDGSEKQNNDSDLRSYASSSKKESDIVESLGPKATDFERRLYEATKIWKEQEEQKRKQLEDELLKEWDDAEQKHLEDELLKGWDDAEQKHLEEKKLGEPQVDAKTKEPDGDLLKGQENVEITNPGHEELREKQIVAKIKHPGQEKLRKGQNKEEGKSPLEKKLQNEQLKVKEKLREPVIHNKSKKRGWIKWAGIILAASLFLCFVAIPFTDNSKGISRQGLVLLDKAPTVVATENNNDTLVREEVVILPEEPPENFTNSIGVKFVLIPEGEFLMGSSDDEDGRFYDREGPVHEVTIEKGYYLGKYEVTQKQWAMVMGSNPSHSTGDNRPVEKVSWYEVQEFINRLNSMEGTDKYRLPSEAEWEYACRAGTNTRYHFGNNESILHEYAWYNEYIYSVGHLRPNNWGLYDMHGNVYEFVQDDWHSGYEGAPTVANAWVDASSDLRTLRSGSLNGDPDTCRSASRTSIDPDLRLSNVGFRLAMDV